MVRSEREVHGRGQVRAHAFQPQRAARDVHGGGDARPGGGGRPGRGVGLGVGGGLDLRQAPPRRHGGARGLGGVHGAGRPGGRVHGEHAAAGRAAVRLPVAQLRRPVRRPVHLRGLPGPAGGGRRQVRRGVRRLRHRPGDEEPADGGGDPDPAPRLRDRERLLRGDLQPVRERDGAAPAGPAAAADMGDRQPQPYIPQAVRAGPAEGGPDGRRLDDHRQHAGELRHQPGGHPAVRGRGRTPASTTASRPPCTTTST